MSKDRNCLFKPLFQLFFGWIWTMADKVLAETEGFEPHVGSQARRTAACVLAD